MVSAARKEKSEVMHLIDLREFFHFMLVQPPKKGETDLEGKEKLKERLG